jgi:hypothetical protein
MTDGKAFGSEKRLFPRWAIGEQGAIRVRGASSACTAIDISAGGFRLKMHARDEIELQLTGIVPLSARVVRVEPGSVAARFTGGPHYLFR